MDNVENKIDEVSTVNGDIQKKFKTETDTAATDLTKEDAAAVATQATDSLDKVVDAFDSAVEASIESDKKGATGVQTKTKLNKLGTPKTITPDALVGKTRALPVTAKPRTTVSDIDRYAENQNAAADAFENIVSDITFEATRQAEEGSTQIVGVPANNSVYSLESDIVPVTLSGETAKHPMNHPRHRSHGSVFVRNPEMIDITGSYVEGLHDEKKNQGNRKLLFNALDEHGRVIPGSFIAPRMGKFWVRGFNPFAVKDSKGFKCNTVTDDISKMKDWKAAGAIVPSGTDLTVNIYTVEDDGGNMFDVVDITTLIDDCSNAIADVREAIEANKSRMQFGLYEVISNLFTNAAIALGAQEKLEYPELNPSMDRCTLFLGDKPLEKETLACNNDLTTLIRYMHGVSQSEVMWSLAPLNCLNPGKDVTFMKAFEGYNKSNPYFNRYSGKYQGQNAVGSCTDPSKSMLLPNLTPYARYLAGSGAFKTAGQWACGFKEFKSRLNTIKQTFTEDVAMTDILKHVYIAEQAIDKLSEVFAYGRVTDNEGMTSNAIAKLPGYLDVIIDVDPNAFVACKGYGVDTTWYPTMGYVNIMTDHDAKYASHQTYSVIPTWIETLVNFTKLEKFRKLMRQDFSSVQHTSNECRTDAKVTCLYKWLMPGTDDSCKKADKRYLPIQLDAFAGSLFPFILAEAYIHGSERTFGSNNTSNAMVNRWWPILSKIGADEHLMAFYKANALDVINRTINNEALDFNPKVSKIADMPMLYDTARRHMLDQRTMLIAVVNVGDTRVEIYSPDEFKHYMQNLKGLTAYIADYEKFGAAEGYLEETNTIGDINISDIIGTDCIIDLLKKNDSNFAKAYAAAKPGQYVPALKYVFKYGNASGDVDNAGTGDFLITAKVPQFNADENFLGQPMEIEQHIYGEDGFFFNEGDAYCLIIQKGYYTGDGIPDSERYDNIALAPVVCQTPVTKTFSRDYKIKVGEKEVTVGHTPTSRTTPAMRALVKPSLYGYNRQVIGGITLLDSSMNGRTSVPARNGDYMMYGLLMPISGVTYGEDTDLTKAMATRGDQEIINPSRLYSQKLFTSHYYNTAPYSLAAMFKLGGWMLDCANHHSIESNIYEFIEFNDQLRRILNFRHCGIFACNVTDRTTVAVDADKAVCCDPFSFYAMEYRSRDAFNDIRRFNYGRPIYWYNREWTSYGQYQALLAEQYLKNE